MTRFHLFLFAAAIPMVAYAFPISQDAPVVDVDPEYCIVGTTLNVDDNDDVLGGEMCHCSVTSQHYDRNGTCGPNGDEVGGVSTEGCAFAIQLPNGMTLVSIEGVHEAGAEFPDNCAEFCAASCPTTGCDYEPVACP